MVRGFITMAFGEVYIRCARALALSLKFSQPNINKLTVVIRECDTITDDMTRVFDQIIVIPNSELATSDDPNWKRAEEALMLKYTPYEATIKLDADMLFSTNVEHWWTCLRGTGFAYTSIVRALTGDVAMGDPYRKVFTSNDLPNVYTACMYFEKQSVSATEVFDLCKTIFDDYKSWYNLHLPRDTPNHVSADVVFALAIKLLEVPNVVHNPMTFCHMKSQLQPTEWGSLPENWVGALPIEFHGHTLTVGNFTQDVPLHYHIKTALTDGLVGAFERAVSY